MPLCRATFDLNTNVSGSAHLKCKMNADFKRVNRSNLTQTPSAHRGEENRGSNRRLWGNPMRRRARNIGFIHRTYFTGLSLAYEITALFVHRPNLRKLMGFVGHYLRPKTNRLTPTFRPCGMDFAGEKNTPCLAAPERVARTLRSFIPMTNDIASKPSVDDSTDSGQSDACPFAADFPHMSSAAEAVKNYRENPSATWYNDNIDPNDSSGRYAFQRLRQTWFTPQVIPKFKLRRDDKFFAIGSCFARGLEHCLQRNGIAVESAAQEFSKLQPVNTET